MLSFFKSIRPVVVAVVVLYGMLVAGVFSVSKPLSKGTYGLGFLFKGWDINYSPFFNFLLRSGILIASAMMLNKAAVKLGIYSRSNYFVALSFLLFTAYSPVGLAQWPILFAVLFISAGYRYWLEFVYLPNYNSAILLNALFFWVIAGLFYWPVFLLGALMPVPLIFASVGEWRAYLLPLVVHFFFFLAVLPWTLLGYFQPHWYEIQVFHAQSNDSFFQLFASIQTAVLLLVMVTIFVFALGSLLGNIRRKKVSNRRIFRVNNVWIVLMIGVWILSPGDAGEVGVLMAVPASFLVGNWLYYLPDRFYWHILFLLICSLPFFMTLII
jgi:hypothetical protein